MGDLDLVVRLAIDWKLDYLHEALAVCRKHEDNLLKKLRNIHISELERWSEEMSGVEAVRSCPDFHCVKLDYTYQKAISKLLLAKRRDAFQLATELPWGRLKVKILVGLCIPVFLIKRWRRH